jgi:hypothetical protein
MPPRSVRKYLKNGMSRYTYHCDCCLNSWRKLQYLALCCWFDRYYELHIAGRPDIYYRLGVEEILKFKFMPPIALSRSSIVWSIYISCNIATDSGVKKDAEKATRNKSTGGRI